jgi:uncharacterized protein (DUF2236 family)
VVDRRQAPERALGVSHRVGPAPRASQPGAAPGSRATFAANAAGLYGPRSETWRLNREAALLLGAGPRALLLQLAHPLVADGVDQHSDFGADPWARLTGTLRSVLRIVYGTTTTARREIRRLNDLHRGVTGPVQDSAARRRHGSRYAARDPELSLWVHATLVDSTMAVAHAWMPPLPAGRRARLYMETRPIGRAFGIPDSLLPADVDAFDEYVAAMLSPAGPVHPTATARQLAGMILHPPLDPLVRRGPIGERLGPAAAPVATLLGRVPSGAYDWLYVPAIGLLPATVRREYGLPWGVRERAIEAWLVTGWRAWRPVIPPTWRWFGEAMAAERRVTLAASPPDTGHTAGDDDARG